MTTDTPQFGALAGSMRDFRYLPGADLLARVDAFYQWQETRRAAGVWPLGRSTEQGAFSRCTARTDEGELFDGVNFASQDYLSLNSHDGVLETAIATMRAFGVHSAGSPALVGNTSLSIALERKIGDFLGYDHVALFPTGWAAGFGVIKGLVRPNDHIVMDALSHACLQEGAQAATRNIHLFRHNQVEAARAKLAKIRSTDTENGILLVTESLFSMDSDTPDIRALQALAHEYGATLVVDVAHDLGNLGPTGRGFIEAQGMLGKVDVVMGSFSKTFASNGGFVAARGRGVKEYMRYYSSPNTFSNAMSPANAAIVGKAFDIVASEEGAVLRRKLMDNILMLRSLLQGCGLEVYGDPSAIVCVKMGSEALARLVSRRLPSLGMLANLVEFPAVPKGQARFRLQVMARHSQHDIIDAVHRLSTAVADATDDMNALETGAATIETLERDRPVVRRTVVEPEAPCARARRGGGRGSLAA
ncbi:aminotransferase class I/II-fold pyridoxal phosphate-dependent enzyme [Microvirga sp. SRT01]|jgi:glycine C-acetyltransferase|uniref:Aminotransferase class I/II-fold pyridoxal phosphate-dependent enzyme n=1 Tax=Sphingomonas longa TaxID=2778730 RepID=A0ABS2DAB8_9SPHN|nr:MULTISPECIES: aminotransferase class I/II-fold pyridoxal phosphate-dependent enzyme [Alphaproteobacteria]MBM6577883.1 aminotransferase class I/II-fold pyridoxal phosphate-dependent enzyme [Sphingomonas sp. BT552]MBR7710924.1 aminotransferase class I/II-fold pyridoxal phosphate-dependent enzyme [Microvirga sp. SRT01]